LKNTLEVLAKKGHVVVVLLQGFLFLWKLEGVTQAKS